MPSTNTIRFLGRNHDLPMATDDGIRIHFVDNLRGNDWIEIAVLIDESTTRASLERAYPLVKQWRERLRDYQGAWRGGGTSGLLDFLYQWHEDGKSYNSLAQWLNGKIAKMLEEGERERAIHVMTDMGLIASDAEMHCRDAEENLAAGRPAWNPTAGPISGKPGLMRERIREWKEKHYQDGRGGEK